MQDQLFSNTAGTNGGPSCLLTPNNLEHEEACKRLGRHRHINSQLADLLAELKQHRNICACKADPAAAARMLDEQLNSLEQLKEECIANKRQIEAITAATLNMTEVHQLEMASLKTLLAETEARHERRIDDVYSPIMFEGW